MYLEHFSIKDKPFSITPNVDYFININDERDPLQLLLFGINNGEGFLKVTGEVGTGKTMLCRKLLDSLGSEFETAYIASPCYSDLDIFFAVATELKLGMSQNLPRHTILQALQTHLIRLHKANKKVVLIIDEAQALTDKALEAIRLLTNLETKNKKLLQVVLFGQPELEVKLSAQHMRQLTQRIVFSCKLEPFTKKELLVYLDSRLKVAGYNKKKLFSKGAVDLLFKASGGIPRIVNILCHKAMLSAYGQGSPMILEQHMYLAVKDTEYVKINLNVEKRIKLLTFFGITILVMGYLSFNFLGIK